MSDFLLYRGPEARDFTQRLRGEGRFRVSHSSRFHVLAVRGESLWAGVTEGRRWVCTGVPLGPHGRPTQPSGSTLPRAPDAGHYAVVTWDNTKVSGWTDTFGLRSLYLATTGSGHVIGTDLLSVARLAGRVNPDPRALSSHWLLQNQLDHRALVAGVERVCAAAFQDSGSGATVVPHPEAQDGRPSSGPQPTARPIGELARLLGRYLGEGTTLGLSGGLDSRLLLAVAPSDQLLHTFGDGADAHIAVRIGSALRREVRRIRSEPAGLERLTALLDTTAEANQAVTPASFSARTAEFEAATRNGQILVDGAFGEFGRRVFMNRLLHRSRLSSEPGAAAEALAVDRCRFLSAEFREQLVAASLQTVRDRLRRPLDADGADRLGLIFRLPNFFGYEQGRLDAVGPAIMPFAQPDVVAALRSLPLHLRQGGRAFRSIIQEHAPNLTRIPLVKGTSSYPFGLPPLLVPVWSRLRRVKGGPSPRDRYLSEMEPVVRDRARSVQPDIFDRSVLLEAIEHYYAGDPGPGNALDWWLAHDAWIRRLRG